MCVFLICKKCTYKSIISQMCWGKQNIAYPTFLGIYIYIYVYLVDCVISWRRESSFKTNIWTNILVLVTFISGSCALYKQNGFSIRLCRWNHYNIVDTWNSAKIHANTNSLLVHVKPHHISIFVSVIRIYSTVHIYNVLVYALMVSYFDVGQVYLWS